MATWNLVLVASLLCAASVATAAEPAVELFPLKDVRLLDGPFRRAQETDHAYLLRLDPDRLMAHIREVAGLKPKAPHYAGWDENAAGTVGHYLSACAQMYAATGDAELLRRVHYLSSEFDAAQRAELANHGDNGIYVNVWEREVFFAKLAKGQVDPAHVTPFYLLHKNLAGLRDAWLLCGDETAKAVLIKACDWVIGVTSRLTDEDWQKLLNAEHGGPHEVFADVYAITGEGKYLDLAQKFVHRKVVDIVMDDDSAAGLAGMHANTQIPKFVGYERMSELGGDPKLHAAALRFWEAVTKHYSWANGSDSQWERFFAPDEFPEKLMEVCGPETCNTYNMLKLTRDLYGRDPSARYVDYYENALYNHILPSEAPGGGFVYYTPMRPGHYRVFSRDYDAFWCCVGTGMENHGKYGRMIYAHSAGRGGGPDSLVVNLFIPSVLTWREKGLVLRQDTTLPVEQRSALTLTLDKPTPLRLAIRRPAWAAGVGMSVKVNGGAAAVSSVDGYAVIDRTWTSGDRIEIDLPMAVHTQLLPHGPNYRGPEYVAFFYGPVMLAGELGTEGLTDADFHGGGPFNAPVGKAGQVASKSIPESHVPVLVGKVSDLAGHLKRVEGKGLTFTTAGLSEPKDVTLKPFYEVFFQRYAIYWKVVPPADKT